jgi:hypothetical protein
VLNFLIVRFTHGTGGKFISSVLQTSDEISHWSFTVQQSKNTPEFEEIVREYTNRSFPINPKYHMINEPITPYNTDLYSSSYPRGNEVTLPEFLAHAINVNDTSLLSIIDTNLKCNLIFHKPNVPLFVEGSDMVTVIVDDSAREWLYKTLWNKHFYVDEENEIIHFIQDDPSLCSFKSLPMILKFKNKYKFDIIEKDALYEKHIINDHTNKWYNDRKNFTEFDRRMNLNNYFINMSDLFNTNRFVNCISDVFDYYKLSGFNPKLVEQMHDIWWSRQL